MITPVYVSLAYFCQAISFTSHLISSVVPLPHLVPLFGAPHFFRNEEILQRRIQDENQQHVITNKPYLIKLLADIYMYIHTYIYSHIGHVCMHLRRIQENWWMEATYA